MNNIHLTRRTRSGGLLVRTLRFGPVGNRMNTVMPEQPRWVLHGYRCCRYVARSPYCNVQKVGGFISLRFLMRTWRPKFKILDVTKICFSERNRLARYLCSVLWRLRDSKMTISSERTSVPSLMAGVSHVCTSRIGTWRFKNKNFVFY